MNPLTYARYKTLDSPTVLARQLEVSKQYISRVEQGLYEKPNPQVMDWVVNQLNKDADVKVTHSQVLASYHEWQKNKRRDAKIKYELEPITPPPVGQKDSKGQPVIVYYHKVFREWREKYWNTTHSFCVDMCLHPSSVSNYEEGKLHTMPNNMRVALTELNLLGEGFRTYER